MAQNDRAGENGNFKAKQSILKQIFSQTVTVVTVTVTVTVTVMLTVTVVDCGLTSD